MKASLLFLSGPRIPEDVIKERPIALDHCVDLNEAIQTISNSVFMNKEPEGWTQVNITIKKDNGQN